MSLYYPNSESFCSLTCLNKQNSTVYVLQYILSSRYYSFAEHKNTKAFITHGGLMGTQEAIYYGVPMIGMPLFADQFINIASYMRHNIAIELEVETLTEEKMDKALNTILNDLKYR